MTIEITEQAMVSDVTSAAAQLRSLSDMGLRLAIDDFGTGYSNISNLKRLPFHSIKIDQSFVRGLHESVQDRAIVQAVAAMARDLGCVTIAEGVETPEAWDILLEMGCDYAQGYHIARPMPATPQESGR